MACSDSAGSNTNSVFCKDDCTKLKLYNEPEEEDAEIVDYKVLLGKVLKEGTINVHDNEEWVRCHIVIREQGITVASHMKQENHKKKTSVNLVMEFSTPQEVGIVMLPDHARRSRESKLFPFAVQKKIKVEDISTEPLRTEKGITNGKLQGMKRDEVILATSNGREMWEWASCIQWLGTTPNEEKIPLFGEACTTSDCNKHYVNADALQSVLLKMFSYKNLPNNPISFEELARANQFLEHDALYFANYPRGFFLQVDKSYDDSRGRLEKPDNEVDDNAIELIIDNHAHTFGLFAYIVLVGTCVHVNEKCFELITSSNLYDISSQVTWKGNSPFSMLCEGDYNSSRNYMVQALWRLGYPKLEEHHAGYSCSQSFSIFVAKPSNLYGVGNVVGGPVHPEDQKLCRYLQDEGDGRDHNKKLTNQLIEASIHHLTEFEADHESKITAVIIPKSITSWGSTVLTKLNISGNGIFDLPEELYKFTSLTHLDLSRNCIFSLSHKLGNLTKLKYFNIEFNLIKELPYTIEKLEQINEFDCKKNPITTPPSAVWSRGIVSVRNFFRDMRESGIEINIDLRVLVLGLSEAGKTSLINGLINPCTTALTRVGDRTVGIEKRTWAMQRNEEQRPVNLLTYDFAGQEEYYITHHLFLGSKALYIIAFDLSKYKHGTLDSQIMLWWDSIQNRVCDVKSNDSKTPKIILVGTHADMVDDAQSRANNIHKSLTNNFKQRMDGLKDRIETFEKELGKLDPRKKAEGINLANEAFIKQKKKEFDKLSAGEKANILSKESEIKKLYHEQQCAIVLPTTILAVSSKDLQNFDSLKEQISSSLTEIGPSGKYFPHLDVPVPRSWFQVRRFVRQQSTQKGYECMKLPRYFKLLSEELHINEDTGRRATKFCHDLGDVLFFEKEDLVFLQPSFLIDIFKYVIRHDHKESTYWTEKMLDRNISEEQFNRGKDLLLQKGELEQWLLEILWSRLYENFSESSIMNNLIQLLETFDIGTSIEQKGQKIISIPEFQPKNLTRSWPKYKDDNEYEMQRWISVDQKLPHGLLKRIQVRIFKKVFKRSGVKDFDLAQNEIYILDKGLTELYCTSGKRTEECPGFGISEGLRLYIRGIDKLCVTSLLSKVYSCVENTLHDYPGLIFNQYVVHTAQSGSSFIKLEKVQALQAAGESKVHISTQILDDTNKQEDLLDKHDDYQHSPCMSKSKEIILNIDNLLPSLPKNRNNLSM